jgi:hypothetical protein
MVPFCMGMLVTVNLRPVGVLLTVVAVGALLMAVLMIMLLLALAAHSASPPFSFFIKR